MKKRQVWILVSVLIAAGLIGLRLAIPTQAPVQPHVDSTRPQLASAVPAERSLANRSVAKLPLAVIPADESIPAPGEMAPATQPALKHATDLAKPKLARRFADVQLPDAEKTPIQQIARIALSFVGADADAEDIWVAAINDPTMPANDRKNLIEDLNEDGFADPDHPTADELPLIVSRLDLIESLAPAAIDSVNFAAFAEAHKDLLDMYRRLTQ